MTGSSATGGLEIALAHAREKFQYHAGQRVAWIRFFFSFASILVAAYVGVFTTDGMQQRQQEGVLMGMGLAFAIAALWFYGLDRRNAFLVKCDEALMEAAEERLAEESGLAASRTVSASEDYPTPLQQSRLLECFFAFAFGLGLLGIAVAGYAR